MSDTVKITLLDTGKRRTTSSSAEEVALANEGSALDLYCSEISVNDEALLQTNPVIGKYETSGDETTAFAFGEVDQIGFGIPKWVLRGVLDFKKTNDKLTVGKLRRFAKTKGVKTISGDLPDLIDGVDNDSVINVRIKSVQIKHIAGDNILVWQMVAHETD